jgi:type IV secretory pathway VirB10-like protein
MRLSTSVVVTIGIATALAVTLLFLLPPRPKERRTPPPVDETVSPSAPEPAPTPVALLPAPPQPTERRARLEPHSAPSLPDPPELPDDASILAKLHDLAASDPEQSLRLARSALERSPSSASAPEFDWNVVKALYNMRRIEEATDEARTMVRNYPDSDFSVDVVRHLLNPQPNP